MKKIVAIIIFLGSISSFAGTTDCSFRIKTDRVVKSLLHQRFVSVSAFTNNNCGTDLTVRITGISSKQEKFVSFSATRTSRSFPVPFPITLDQTSFVRLGEDTIELRMPLQVGDTLFLGLSSVGLLPFVIQ